MFKFMDIYTQLLTISGNWYIVFSKSLIKQRRVYVLLFFKIVFQFICEIQRYNFILNFKNYKSVFNSYIYFTFKSYMFNIT